MTAQSADGRATAADIRYQLADVIAPALRPEPDIAAPRARTEALAAKHPLSPHPSHDGAVR
ncbi:hypothetical protein AB0E04_26020 [Streptomyces sp. NPDC048251]|uniref:hypothetical protein n=1 Tax=Streptomyces sp. NPDC048251 TaxID=3154501 RepID=UPI003421755C